MESDARVWSCLGCDLAGGTDDIFKTLAAAADGPSLLLFFPSAALAPSAPHSQTFVRSLGFPPAPPVSPVLPRSRPPSSSMSDPVVEKKEAVSPEAAKETTPEPEKKKREYKDFGEEDDKPTRAFFHSPSRLSTSLLNRVP